MKNKKQKQFLIVILTIIIIFGLWFLYNSLVSKQGQGLDLPKTEDEILESSSDKIVFDVFYINRIEDFLDEKLKWADVISIPIIFDSDSKKRDNFNDYIINDSYPGFYGPIVGFEEYSLLKENLLAEQAKEFTESFIESQLGNKEIDRYFQCSPLSYFIKKEVVSIVFFCDGSGGAHPISYISTVNYDLKNSREINLEDFLELNQEELKLFIKEKKERARLCNGFGEDNIAGFYITEEQLIIIFSGHRLNQDCTQDSEFSFSFKEIENIVKKESIIEKLTK